ncbi:MAG: fimbrillin family protein [Bacteroidaceae bacterium]
MKIKRILYILPLVVTIMLLMGACVNEAQEEIDDKSYPLDVKVTTFNFSKTLGSRATTGLVTNLTTGDKIGLIALNGNVSVYDNIPLTLGADGKWTVDASSGIKLYYYPKVTYFVYYPYNVLMDGKTSAETIKNTFTVPLDQTSSTNYTLSDLMISAPIKAVKGQTMNFELSHKLSLVQISVKNNKGAEVTSLNMKAKVGADIYSPLSIGGGAYQFLTKDAASINMSVTFEVAGKTYQCDKKGVNLPQGKYYSFTVVQ